MLLDAGMDDFVRKPYRVHEIYEGLTRHLGLKFLYRSGAPQTEAARAVALTPARLAALPAGVREELREAVVMLDHERIGEVLLQVREADADLGQALAGLAENFDYTAILSALGRQTNGPEALPEA